MIKGVHAIVYSRDAKATRAFFRDVMGFQGVDAGDGWLIFALPPAELGIHPADKDEHAELYFLCDDVEKTVKELQARGVKVSKPISDEGWGRVASLRIPGGVEIAVYEPRHPTAI